MDDINLQSKIEGFLFWKGEPVEKKELAAIFSSNISSINEACAKLREDFLNRGVRLLETDDSVEIRTHESLEKIIEQFNKEILSKELSKAALETLAIVLYKNSVTRSEIDYIRGVNSTFTLRALAMRGLVEKYVDQKDTRKILYKPTIDLLGYLGIDTTAKLPSYEEINSILNSKAKLQEETQQLSNQSE